MKFIFFLLLLMYVNQSYASTYSDIWNKSETHCKESKKNIRYLVKLWGEQVFHSDTAFDITSLNKFKEALSKENICMSHIDFKSEITERYNKKEFNEVKIVKFDRQSIFYANSGKEFDFSTTEARLYYFSMLWNATFYTYSYSDKVEGGMDSLLEKFIPFFISAENHGDIERLTLEFMVDLNDSHAGLENPSNNIAKIFGLYTLPYYLKITEGKKLIVIGERIKRKPFMSDMPLKRGDVITHIDNISIVDIVKKISSYVPASTKNAKYRDLSYYVGRSNNKSVVLSIQDGSFKREIKHSMIRYDSIELPLRNYTLDSIIIDNSLYVDLSKIDGERLEQVLDENYESNKWIFDLRGYPEFFLLEKIFSRIADSDFKFLSFKGKTEVNNKFFPVPADYWIRANDRYPKFKGKIIVLIDEYTQSRAEMFAMAFKWSGKNVTFIGSNTAGCNGSVISLHLPGGIIARYTGVGIFNPDGSDYQGIGISPHISVSDYSYSDILYQDEYIKKALSYK